MALVGTAVEAILFLILLVLVYTLESGFLTIYGALYLVSLSVAMVVTVKMRETIEVVGVGQLAPA